MIVKAIIKSQVNQKDIKGISVSTISWQIQQKVKHLCTIKMGHHHHQHRYILHIKDAKLLYCSQYYF